MTTLAADRPSAMPAAVTLVWIDSREAIIARDVDRDARFAHILADVPAHHHATGHVRHDPRVRHGGSGPHAAGEPNRLEHLARFLATVARRLPSDEDLLLIGPGTVHEHLARLVREQDGVHRNGRRVTSGHAARMSRRQLTARLRRAMGEEPRRHSVGAYRWTSAGAAPVARDRAVWPRRVVEKRSHRPDDVASEGQAEAATFDDDAGGVLAGDP
jgi:hypothetical protein